MNALSRRARIVAAGLGLTLVLGAPAQAGCLSGAAAGGIAGHFLGHHAVLGALGGCLIGHHLAVKKDREREADAAIADASTSTDPAQVTRDRARIEKLAGEHVGVAQTWLQQHPKE